VFQFWPENYDASWLLARPLAEAMYGGGETFEILRAGAQIAPESQDSWHRAFQSLADAVFDDAERADQAGHPVTARDGHLRASIYYRWAEYFLPIDDPRRLAAYDRCAMAFRKAAQRLPSPAEAVEIPYAGTTLPGYFFRAADGADTRAPCILYIAGSDVLKEELYFLGGKAALDRHISVLVIDGPGQGATLRHQKLYSLAEYERPIGAAFDFLVARPDVDPARLGLVGRSMGGYYAARAAAFEPRIKACLLFGALYDAADLFDTYPPLRPQFQWLTGAPDLATTRECMAAFNLEGLVDKIRCPLLIVHGEDDHVVPVWHAQRVYDEATAPKELVLYRHGEPGAVHCAYDGFPEVMPTMFDWLSDRLAGQPWTPGAAG
jgi:dienelactone hydrolase